MAAALTLALAAFWAAVAILAAMRKNSPDLWMATLAVAATGAVVLVAIGLAAWGGRAAARQAAGIVAISGLAAMAFSYPLGDAVRHARVAAPSEGAGDLMGKALTAGFAAVDVLLILGGGGALVAVVFGAVWLVLRLWRG